VIVRRLTAFSDRLEFWLAIRLAERTVHARVDGVVTFVLDWPSRRITDA
jgi:hypothetical protein